MEIHPRDITGKELVFRNEETDVGIGGWKDMQTQLKHNHNNKTDMDRHI